MTPQEMIVGVNLELQKVNTNVISSVEDEEIEWILNDEMLRYLKNRIKDFEEHQKRLDDLENLIVSASLPAYVDTTADRVFGYLPHNYLHRVNDRSLVKDLCGAAYSPTVANTSFYTGKYQLPSLTLANYSSLQLSCNGTLIFNTATYFPSGLPDALAKFQLMNYIIEVINRQTHGVTPAPFCKYERFKDQFINDGIILAADSAYTFQYVHTGSSGTQQVTITNNSKSTVSTVSGSVEVKNRLTRSSKLYDVLGSAIAPTLASSPVSEIRDGKLYVWHKKKFIVSGIKLDYIRRPQKISVTLNQGCELNENVHGELVVNAAKRLAGLTQSSVYPNLINENLLKE